MKKSSVWVWSLASVVSISAFSCAKVDGGGTGDGDGDGSGGFVASGGSSSGGFTVVMSGGAPMGGAQGTGGLVVGVGGMVDACEDGTTDDCANQFVDYPVGTTTCSGGAWDISTCLVCEPDSTVACSVVMPTKPEGSLTCDSTGLDFVEDPITTCATCVVDATTSCDNPGNTTPNKKGEATCLGASGYDWGECKLCLSGDSLACDEVPGNTTLLFGTADCDPSGDSGTGAWDLTDCDVCEAGVQTLACTAIVGGAEDYTGGTATCNGSGDGWNESTCTYCGDGIKNDGEACDGSDLTASTCDAEGFTPGDMTAVNSCTGECILDTSVCGFCPAGVASGDCMEGGGCQGTACDGKACGSTFTCAFNCLNNSGSQCDDTICSAGATCGFNCQNSGGCPGSTCKAGATCNYNCENSGSLCTGLTCEDGAFCDLNCKNGGTCSTTAPIYCKSGDTCILNCENQADCSGVTMVCEAGSTCNMVLNQNANKPTVTCEDGSTCNLSCANQNCSSNVTCESGATCNCQSGTCGF